jgi:hypothetical protein
MAHTTQVVPLQKIYLDNENARYDPIDSEPEITAHLIAHEYVRALARDIVRRGSTSPLERMAVIPHPEITNAYITAEGNRRLCALKLLHEPDKAPEGERSYFRQLGKEMNSPVTSMEVVVFKDREAARPWVSLRHEGAQDGVGTRTWTTRQKARFDEAGGRPTNPNLLAVAVIDYALKKGLITPKDHARINVTTVTRFLGNPVVRNVLGLGSRWELKINVPEAEFDVVLVQFLKDALAGGKSGVTSRTDKDDREAYAHKLRKEGVAPKSRLKAPLNLDSKTGKVAGGVSASAKKLRHTRNPDTRPHVVPTEFVVQIRNRVLKRVYDELRGIDAEDYSFAAGYLFRAFIEQAARLFCKQYSLGFEGDLHVLLGRVARKLEADDALTNHQLKPLRVMASDKDNRLSPDSLGAWVHGSMIPTRAELNRRWETLEPCLRAILDRLN